MLTKQLEPQLLSNYQTAVIKKNSMRDFRWEKVLVPDSLSLESILHETGGWSCLLLTGHPLSTLKWFHRQPFQKTQGYKDICTSSRGSPNPLTCVWETIFAHGDLKHTFLCMSAIWGYPVWVKASLRPALQLGKQTSEALYGRVI